MKMANEKIEGLMQKARAAQAQVADYTQEQADDMVRVVAKRCWAERERIAQLCVDDTGKGTYEFKLGKMENTTASVYMYLKGRKSVGLVEHDEKKKLWKYAKPVGVLACITPVTNPAATPIGNGLNVLKTRNAMIVCPHPGARKATGDTVELMRTALRENGHPEDLVQVVPESTVQDAADLMAAVDLILATGGPGMVKAAYSSGKPALGVGQGNVQCILDEDYDDLEKLVSAIVPSRMVDYGMPCTGEQTVHCPASKLDALIRAYASMKCHYIDDEAQIQKLRETLFVDGAINREIVGQPSYRIAKMAGIDIPEDTTLLLLKVGKCGKEEVLAKEILAPITRIFPYDSFEEAVERARTNMLMEGAGHSSCIWSNNPEHVAFAASRIPAGRVMVNQPATNGSGRQNNGLGQTVSLGCGYWGGNSVYHNVNYKDMLNYTIVSEILEDRKVLTPKEIMAD